MRRITLTAARAQLSTLIDDAIGGRPTVITRRGREEAVIVSFDDWDAHFGAQERWKLILSAPIEPGDIPERDRRPMRDVDF